MGRYALLVSIGDYQDTRLARLRSPAQDVHRLAAVLEDPDIGGYTDVAVLENADDHAIRRALKEIADTRSREDVVLVYFACHAMVDTRRRMHFAAANTALDRPAGTAVPHAFVHNVLADSPAVGRLLVLDCCFSGMFAEGYGSQRGLDATTVDVEGERDYAMLSATNSFEYAYEADRVAVELPRASMFTDVLIAGLASGDADLDGDGVVEAIELYRYAHDEMRRLDPKQVPHFTGRARGASITVARAAGRVSRPVDGTRVWSVAVVELNGASAVVTGTDDGVVMHLPDGGEVRVNGPAVHTVAHVPSMASVLCGDTTGAVVLRPLADLHRGEPVPMQRVRVDHVVTAEFGGRLLGAAADDTGISVWDVRARTSPLVFEPGIVSVTAFATADDGRPLVLAGTQDGHVTVFSLTGSLVASVGTGSTVHGLAVAVLDGREHAVTTHADGLLRVWPVDEPARHEVVHDHGAPLRAVAVLDDRRTAVVGGADGRVVAIDLATGDVVAETDADRGVVWSIAGRRSARGPEVVAGTDHGVWSWEPPVGTRAPRQHAGFAADVVAGADRLGITAEVDTLCDMILAREVTPPLSVGLFGDWGTGKSFFMARMRERVDRLAAESRQAVLEGVDTALCSTVCQIEFNAWHYVDADLWASLAATIFDGLAATAPDAVSREVLRDLPSVRELRDDLAERRARTGRLLDAANEELAKESPVGVRDVLTRDQLAQAAAQAAERVDDVLVEAGVPEEDVKKLDLRAMTETSGVLGRDVVFVLRRTRWSVRLAVLAAVLLVVAGPIVATALWKEHLGLLATGVSAVVVCGVAALLLVQGPLNRAAKAFAVVKDLVDGVDARRRAPAEARRDALRRRMADIEREIADLDARIEELGRANSVSAFAVQRHEGDQYRRHEGLVATLRRDLEELSRRLTERGGGPADLERIVLYVDDLDRCPGDRVVEVLQAIHLLLAFPLFVVVVGVDSRWLLRALDGYLRADPTGDDVHASTPQNYLEKIFQISLCLRPMSEAGYAGLVDASVGALEAAAEPAPATSTAPVGQVPAAPPTRLARRPRRRARARVTGRRVRRYAEPGRVRHVGFDPERPAVVSVHATGVLVRWDLRSEGADRVRKSVADGGIAVVHPLVGRRLLVVGSFDAAVVDAVGGEVVHRIAGTADRAAVASPDSDDISFHWAEDGVTHRVDATASTALVEGEAAQTGMGTPLALTGSWRVDRVDDHVVLRNAGGEAASVSFAGAVSAVIDPVGERVAVFDGHDGVAVLDLGVPDRLAVTNPAAVVAFGPRTAAAVAHGEVVRVWDTATGDDLAEITADAEVTALAFAPDGGRVVTGSASGVVEVWVIREARPNVDLTASALRLTPEEREAIIAVRPFIGTPRSAKRLINTYRLLRAGLGEAELAALRAGEHRVVLLLLAILLGVPDRGQDLLRRLSGDTAAATFTALVRRPVPRRGRTAVARPPVDAFARKVVEVVHGTGVPDDIDVHRRWAGVVARYSFRTAHR
ncbi:caspase, EACC1-associated type [Saccharothrix obliqua]|uniref:caspase, EACC1-associated type n=1 Tax=Saccharothrix obliqua TaxID=2861747 RepID=UPI001C5F81F4|nr:P-loop NTPase fold protein [Saccharothrix obliqua]MBW4720550.1 hypothetical protein [Saccharothrix obliqua]